VSRSDTLANVVAYVPLGLLLVLATTRRSGAAQIDVADASLAPSEVEGAWRPYPMPPLPRLVVTAIGGVAAIALLSLSMEVAQACQAGRVSSAYDLLANATGGALGMLAGLALRSFTAGVGARTSSQVATYTGRLHLLTVAVAAVWVVSQATPWVFAVDLGMIRRHLSFLRHWSDGLPLDAWRFARHVGAWVAIGCAVRLVWPTRAALTGFSVAAGVSLVQQVLLDVKAPLSLEELAGMATAAAFVLVALALLPAEPHRRHWPAGMLLAAMVTVAAYELRPDSGAAQQAFRWWPQVGLGEPHGAIDYALLFGWFGLVSVVAAHWAHTDGHRQARRVWPVAAVLLTLAFEVLQTRIPGRGPDLSAPLFTLLAVLTSTAALGDGRDIEG
jgi:VanZ family protein